MSTTGKTPVSLLSEVLVRKRIQPLYSLLMSGAGTNQGIFIYEVTAGDVLKARGRGRSKKEAKQDAAKNALLNLKSGLTGEPPEDELPVPCNDFVSPYQEQLRENAVGSLNELCTISQLPMPDYNLIREDGPPHAKVFELSCKVSTFEYCAKGRTKQQAKQQAAKLMLETLEKLKLSDLNETPVIPAPEETPEEHEQLMAEIRIQRAALGLTNKVPQRSLLGQQMGARLKHEWTLEKLTQVKALRVPTHDYYAQLQIICNELNLKVKSQELPSLKPIGIVASKVRVISLTTQPELSFLGSGQTCEAANDKAARRALSFFDIMIV